MKREGRRAARKPIIGLMGGVGSGKSTLARMLAELGAGVVDADRIARALLADPEVVEVLRQWWGDSILLADGGVDRRRVGDIVFGDPAARRRLEHLLHPRVARERSALVARLQADPAIRAIVLDSPLLFESGLHHQCDTVWFVEAEREQRVQRVVRTRGWSPVELDRRESSQAHLSEKKAKADQIIVNTSGIEDLRAQVIRGFKQLLESRAHAGPPDEPAGGKT